MEPQAKKEMMKRFNDANQGQLKKSFGSMFDKVVDLKGEIPEAKCKNTKLKHLTSESIYNSYNLHRETTTTTSSSPQSHSHSHSNSNHTVSQTDYYGSHQHDNTTIPDDIGQGGSQDRLRCSTDSIKSQQSGAVPPLEGLVHGVEGIVGGVVGGVLDSVLGGGGGEDEAHPWQKAGHGDKRGPCPGLNVIANHGYIPRNGIVNPLQLMLGTYQGLHLSPDLSAFLAALSFVGMGDLTTMSLSIGSKYGLGDGLNHHGILEGDASVTRGDHHFGNSWDAQPELVEQFINETNTYGNGNVDVVSLGESRYRAWENSRQNNPFFDFNPWRLIVAYAESGFVHEVLRGNFELFDEAMIRSWFTEERFPPCWKPRPLPMSTPEVLAWASVVFVTKPTIPGWSIGKKGAFIPLPTKDGAYQELSSFLNPAETGSTVATVYCAAANAALSFFPSQITNLLGTLGLPKIGSEISCPGFSL